MVHKILLLVCYALVFIASIDGCQRLPKIGQSRGHRSPGDNGFRISLSENIDHYKPGAVYTVSISEEKLQKKFTRFLLTAENVDDNESPQKRGTFQLFGDILTTFHEICVNTIVERNDAPKSAVEVMWTAPPSGSGCVILRAMVLQDRYRWFADEGKLSLKLCQEKETVSSDECCACDEAKYSFTFEGIWSNITHPRDFPTSLWLTHFSDVIGASHEANFSFWGEGHISTDGFRSLAEWGSPQLLDRELRIRSKQLRSIIRAGGLWFPNVNANTSSSFKVDRKRHLISLVSMLGPSPDWVVGVNGLNLCRKDCTWQENLVIDLELWDAGTDSGITYMSPNTETVPKERMYRITTKYPEDPRAPFYNPNEEKIPTIAKLYINREKVIPKNCDDTFLITQLDENENTEDRSRPECAVNEWTSWSKCNVACGKGLRMRTREYILPQKAQMLQCNRQLVSKEMCVASIPECNGGNEPESSEETPELESLPEGICSVTPWSEWTECSETCGKGFKMRNRHFLDRMGIKKCPHITIVEKDVCMISTACTHVDTVNINCPVTEWTDWSPCPVTCGGNGVTLRKRFFKNSLDSQKQECEKQVQLIQQKPCGQAACPEITPDVAHEICMQPAEVGPCRGNFPRWYFEPKKLMCVPFAFGGCRGNQNNFVTADECNNLCQHLRNTINTESQSDDCIVSEWGPWAECSKICGPGRTNRTRYIIKHPENGGNPCPLRLIKWKRCVGRAC